MKFPNWLRRAPYVWRPEQAAADAGQIPALVSTRNTWVELFTHPPAVRPSSLSADSFYLWLTDTRALMVAMRMRLLHDAMRWVFAVPAQAEGRVIVKSCDDTGLVTMSCTPATFRLQGGVIMFLTRIASPF